MHSLSIGLVAFISLTLPITSAFAQTDQEPPTAVIVSEDFSPMEEAWQPASGTWSVGGGTYGSSSAGSHDISTITSYRGVHPAQPPDTQLRHSHFFVRARMRNQGTTDNHLVGLVYQYQDSQNYYEVVISALGTVTMRTVTNGVAVDEAPPITPHIPRNTWFDVEVRWNNGVTSLKIDGSTAYTSVSQPEYTTGQVGLVTHAAVGRFDKVFVGVPLGDQGFLEMFEDAPFVTFTPQSGQWAVANGTYNNTTVQQTSVSLAPIRTGILVGDGDTLEYTFRARLLNPYGASGNLVGIVFNYEGTQYTEVVFSPTGLARMNRFANGAVQTLATASYNGRRNVPFEVTLENSPDGIAVIVDGERIFENTPNANPNIYPQGGVGLITHWAPGRFDNIQFDHGVFRPCSFTFGSPPPSHWIVSGTWNVNGGTLNNTSPGASDIVNLNCAGNSIGDDAGTNAIYSARLLNEYGASGNLVGLIYNYHQTGFYAGDYFEVVFSPTGVMRLNKFIQGVRYNVGTFAHNIPRNTWFDVQVIRDGVFTTVKVNGATIAQLIPQESDLTGGSIGVITHWAKGRFDNVSLTEYVSLPP